MMGFPMEQNWAKPKVMEMAVKYILMSGSELESAKQEQKSKEGKLQPSIVGYLIIYFRTKEKGGRRSERRSRLGEDGSGGCAHAVVGGI